MAASGSVSVGKLIYIEDSLTLDQIADVTASAPTHNDVIIYKNNIIDPGFTTGWHSNPLSIEDLTNVEIGTATVAAHNEVIAYNDGTDVAVPVGWVNRPITSLFTGLETTIEGIVSSVDSINKGEQGNPGLTDMIMMTDSVSGGGPTNLSIGSAFDNNAIFKKEPTDTAFIFVQTLSKGEIANLTYPVSTQIRSTKGICGLTGPFPTPLGLSSFALKRNRFSSTVLLTTLVVSSMGTEVEVTLFESDGITVADGPTIIPIGGIISLACNSIGEFLMVSTGFVTCYINENDSRMRLLPPMSTELIGWNRNATLSSLSGTATVTWHRRNGVTGTQSVVEGTPIALDALAGNNQDYANNGGIILRSDKPITAFAYDDTAGNQAAPYWPMDQLAQVFPNPSFLDDNIDNGISAIHICSPYEGSVIVYDSTDTEIASFNVTRTNPVVTAADQLFPANGRWQPEDDALLSLDGGYIVCTVPCTCIMNFSGSSVWTSAAGQEMAIVGTTPDNIKAEIRKDASNIFRRRDLSAAGVVTWTVC